MKPCTHRSIRTWSSKTGEPVPFWICDDCGSPFEPIAIDTPELQSDFMPSNDQHNRPASAGPG